VGVALRSEADDGAGFALKCGQVGVVVIIGGCHESIGREGVAPEEGKADTISRMYQQVKRFSGG
jgi:hypothetical protein